MLSIALYSHLRQPADQGMQQENHAHLQVSKIAASLVGGLDCGLALGVVMGLPQHHELVRVVQGEGEGDAHRLPLLHARRHTHTYIRTYSQKQKQQQATVQHVPL